MIVAPETEIYLIKAPLQVDELHQLDFANETAQVNYFQSLPKLALLRCTYQRENQRMYVSQNIEVVRQYNYVMYKNKQYSNKWFYAFIVGIEYEGNTVTAVQIRTDVFQTYMFEYQIKRSYIKRETVSDDTFGRNLVTENLDYGDYILNGAENENLVVNSANYNNKTPLIVIQCSEKIGQCYEFDGELPAGDEIEDMYIIGGLPQGCWYYMFYNTLEQLTAVRELKKYLDSQGKGNAILNIFVVPQQAVDTRYCLCRLYDKEGALSNSYVSCYIAQGNTFLPKQLFSKTLTRPTKIGNYTPVNNKTLCYPYNYFLVTNNSGGALDFHYEDFNGDPNFRCIGTLSVNNCFALLANNSKKSQNVEYGINTEMLMGTSLPCLSWDSDYYLNWIAQNGQSIRNQYGQLSADAIGNALGGTVQGGMQAGAVGAGVQFGVGVLNYINDSSDFIENTEEKIRQAKAVPNSVSGNMGAGDLAYAIYGSVGFKFYNYQIREEIAVKIDRYFSMYGYRVNEIKTPNLKSRRYWNYIQTIGVNLEGNIPQEALSELKAIYNAGLTIWHDPSQFMNYELVNNIL